MKLTLGSNTVKYNLYASDSRGVTRCPEVAHIAAEPRLHCLLFDSAVEAAQSGNSLGAQLVANFCENFFGGPVVAETVAGSQVDLFVAKTEVVDLCL